MIRHKMKIAAVKVRRKKMRKRQIQSGKQKRIIIKQVQRLEDGRNNN